MIFLPCLVFFYPQATLEVSRMWWIYPVYAVDLIAMVALSFLLGNLVDMLDKKTKISGAFIGGVMLAAVTSLPELFTALSSIFLVNEPEYVVGDILGSIIFDLVCLVLETFIFVKNFKDAKLDRFHLVNGAACLAMYGFAAYAFFAPQSAQLMLGDINAMSILIFALYILTLIFQPKEEEKEDEDEGKEVKWSLKTIIILFVTSSLALIGTSIALTYLTKMIQTALPALSGSVAGALLLGIGTSIPEIVSTAQLFKKKNYDAGFGNMIGSCTFDFAIFAVSDFLTWHQYNNHTDADGNYIISQRGLFILDADSRQFEIFGIAVCALTLLLIMFKCFTKFFNKKKAACYTITGGIALACLAMYLIIFII